MVFVVERAVADLDLGVGDLALDNVGAVDVLLAEVGRAGVVFKVWIYNNFLSRFFYRNDGERMMLGIS